VVYVRVAAGAWMMDAMRVEMEEKKSRQERKRESKKRKDQKTAKE
jgi:hypothetical protein